jgi:hypothetical protein
MIGSRNFIKYVLFTAIFLIFTLCAGIVFAGGEKQESSQPQNTTPQPVSQPGDTSSQKKFALVIGNSA